jgi:hypothetical protein
MTALRDSTCVISHFLPWSIGAAVFEAYNGGSLHTLIARKMA